MKLLKLSKKKAHNLLKWSEQYIKTDMVYLTKGGFWLSLERVVTTLLTLALGIAFGNLVPSDTYGIYKYVVASASIVGAISLSGFGTAITQAVARGFDGALNNAIITFFRYSFGITLVALAGSGYYFFQDNTTLATGFLLIALFMPFQRGFEFYKGFLNGKKHFKQHSLLQIASDVTFVITLIGIMLFSDDVLLLLAGFFVANTLTTLSAFLYTKYYYSENTETDPSTTRFGSHLSVMRFLQTLTRHGDKILAFTLLGATPLAVYSFAILPVEKARGFSGVIRSLVLPKFSNLSFEEIRRTVFRKVAILFLFFASGTLAYIITAPYLFNLLLPQYTEAVPYSQVLSLLLLTVPFSLLGVSLTAHQKTKEMYILNVFENTGRLLLMATLIPFYGLWGLVVALLVTQFVRIFALYVMIFKK